MKPVVKRLLRRLAVGFLLPVLVGAAIVAWLLTSQSGARWAFSQVGILMEGGVKAVGVEGRLASPLTIRGLVYETESIRITVETLTLNGQMRPYAWGLNGAVFGSGAPLRTSAGRRLRVHMINETMMAHPMHVHGHTWSLPASGGLRKDTGLVLPMQTITADMEADNPGRWAYHCHNIYHAEIGMMTSLDY